MLNAGVGEYAVAETLATLTTPGILSVTGSVGYDYGELNMSSGSFQGNATAQNLSGTAQIMPDSGQSIGQAVLVQVSEVSPVQMSGDANLSTQIGQLGGPGSYVAHIGDTININMTSSAEASDSSGSFGDQLRAVSFAEYEITLTDFYPTINTSAGPGVMLGNDEPLTDTATLSGAYNPTGTITFTLTSPSGLTVDTEAVNVSGDGTYSTPTGYVPSGMGTLAGTYQWQASYSGDANNAAVASTMGSEPVTVAPASPTIATTASPRRHAGAHGPDPERHGGAVGRLSPDGLSSTTVFTLTGPGGFSYSKTDTVNGNGTYTASTSCRPRARWRAPTPGRPTTSGDVNNNAADDQGGPTEQTVVSPASPTIVTTASRYVTLGAAAPDPERLGGAVGRLFPDGLTPHRLQLTGPGGFSKTRPTRSTR